jgi:hypothetical protein
MALRPSASFSGAGLGALHVEALDGALGQPLPTLVGAGDMPTLVGAGDMPTLVGAGMGQYDNVQLVGLGQEETTTKKMMWTGIALGVLGGVVAGVAGAMLIRG